MRKRFDAHVHLMPDIPVGAFDPGLNVTKGNYGRLMNRDGGVIQYLPPYMKDSSFTADTLIEVMDMFGVEYAMILSRPSQKLLEEAVAAIQRYPDRLRASMAISFEAGSEDQMEQWARAGLTGIKIEMQRLQASAFDSERMYRVMEQAAKWNLTVTIDPGPPRFEGYQPEKLEKLIESFPALRFVICHLGVPSPNIIGRHEMYSKWEAMIELAQKPNVWFDVTAIPDLYAGENFPYPTALNLVKKAAEKYGSRKLLWGTDIPGTFKNATYCQMIEMFERCDFLSEQDKDRLFWQNAMEVYFNRTM